MKIKEPKEIYNKNLFTPQQKRDFENILFEISKSAAAKALDRHSRTKGWTFDDFLGQATEIAVLYSKKAQEIYLTQNPNKARSYLFSCITLKLNNFAWNEHVIKKHNISYDFTHVPTDLTYTQVEIALINKNPEIENLMLKTTTEEEFRTLYMLFFWNMSIEEVALEEKRSTRTISDRKRKGIERMVLAS